MYGSFWGLWYVGAPLQIQTLRDSISSVLTSRPTRINCRFEIANELQGPLWRDSFPLAFSLCCLPLVLAYSLYHLMRGSLFRMLDLTLASWCGVVRRSSITEAVNCVLLIIELFSDVLLPFWGESWFTALLYMFHFQLQRLSCSILKQPVSVLLVWDKEGC